MSDTGASPAAVAEAAADSGLAKAPSGLDAQAGLVSNGSIKQEEPAAAAAAMAPAEPAAPAAQKVPLEPVSGGGVARTTSAGAAPAAAAAEPGPARSVSDAGTAATSTGKGKGKGKGKGSKGGSATPPVAADGDAAAASSPPPAATPAQAAAAVPAAAAASPNSSSPEQQQGAAAVRGGEAAGTAAVREEEEAAGGGGGGEEEAEGQPALKVAALREQLSQVREHISASQGAPGAQGAVARPQGKGPRKGGAVALTGGIAQPTSPEPRPEQPPARRLSEHDKINTTNALELLTSGTFRLAPGKDVVPYEQLITLRLEDGVDVTRKEEYLSAEEFATVLKMERAEFVKLPQWKKLQLKKAVQLF